MKKKKNKKFNLNVKKHKNRGWKIIIRHKQHTGKTDNFVSIKAKLLWNNRFRVNYYTKVEINKVCRETISHSWFVVVENNEILNSSPIIKQLGKPARRKTIEELIGEPVDI